jgi:hypothetical protein
LNGSQICLQNTGTWTKISINTECQCHLPYVSRTQVLPFGERLSRVSIEPACPAVCLEQATNANSHAEYRISRERADVPAFTFYANAERYVTHLARYDSVPEVWRKMATQFSILKTRKQRHNIRD